MKFTVKKCNCGRVCNPFQLSIVDDTWLKNNIEYYQYKCPQCRKTHVIEVVHEEK